MFERFTERARRVMGLARQESQRLGSEFIGTEHILLGILHEGDSIAARVLRSLEVDYKRVRQQIEMLVPSPGSPKPVLGQVPFSTRSKRAIELAAEASVELGHDVIGVEHLLMGLVGDPEGIAATVLSNLGLRLEDVHRNIMKAIGAPDPAAATVREAPWSDRTRSVVLEAASEAKAMRSPSVDPEHLLLAILGEGGPLREMLEKRGVTAEAIRGIIPRL